MQSQRIEPALEKLDLFFRSFFFIPACRVVVIAFLRLVGPTAGGTKKLLPVHWLL